MFVGLQSLKGFKVYGEFTGFIGFMGFIGLGFRASGCLGAWEIKFYQCGLGAHRA